MEEPGFEDALFTFVLYQVAKSAQLNKQIPARSGHVQTSTGGISPRLTAEMGSVLELLDDQQLGDFYAGQGQFYLHPPDVGSGGKGERAGGAGGIGS